MRKVSEIGDRFNICRLLDLVTHVVLVTTAAGNDLLI